MPADKKIKPEKLPRPPDKPDKFRNQEEFDDKSRDEKARLAKPRRINYVIKDLPIY